MALAKIHIGYDPASPNGDVAAYCVRVRKKVHVFFSKKELRAFVRKMKLFGFEKAEKPPAV